MTFIGGKWEKEINVRDFIVRNYTPYDGDENFLSKPTKRTIELWDKVKSLMQAEREHYGVYDIDNKTISTITSHEAGYIDKDLETIVGIQTDEPLKRAIMPFGGIRLVERSLQAYGRELDPCIAEIFKYHKTHNDGVFDVYTDEMKKVRHTGIITGLPDTYGRGRIIGDYRRVPLYGVDFLIEKKKDAKKRIISDTMDDEIIRLREEISDQIRALEELKTLANIYGYDISKPAQDTKEAIQWLYFAYLAAIKEQNGAAMSLGRVSTFLDIYAEKDLKEGRYTEEEIQEFVDHFIMKLRMVRFLRLPEYNDIFAGDPVWATEAIGGMCLDGRTMVTKMSYRFLHTLVNLGPAPEPNLTVLWSNNLPSNFKRYCAKISIITSSIQYENDDIMRVKFGDDYGIACCVSAMEIGKKMQLFGARINLPKALLYAINGGIDEKTGEQIGPRIEPITSEYLDYKEVKEKYDLIIEWLTKLYINTLNVIHYMHDKYYYEKLEMSLHDENVERVMACGIAGLSVVADSLSAIKYSKVKVIRDKRGLVVDFEIDGDYPKFGNNDDKVDDIAKELIIEFESWLNRNKTYRDAKITVSVLTITSNVMYGQKTGSTPDGRKKGEPFAPGANPMHGRDVNGSLAVMKSLSKLPYEHAEDGISFTFTILPNALGEEIDRKDNLATLLDGYFMDGGHHINVNVLNRELLIDAMEHPENYPHLSIRVSGYCVHFTKLSKEQQLEVINRTIHEKM